MTSKVQAEAFLNTIIEPALQAIQLWSPGAAQLLLGTAIQESRLSQRHQLGGGPALGLWQMEPFTYADIHDNYLKYRPDLMARVLKLGEAEVWPDAEWLVAHDKFACGLARVKYLRAPTQLPSFGDIAGQARYWKVNYNSLLGAGSEQEYISNWNSTMGD